MEVEQLSMLVKPWKGGQNIDRFDYSKFIKFHTTQHTHCIYKQDLNVK